MNLPNSITLGRLFITAGTFVCLEFLDPNQPAGTLAWVAFTLFMVAAVTDFLDGWLARRYQQVTAFGRVADPFVDKILIGGTLIILLKFGDAIDHALDTWFVVIVIAREFLVTALRGMSEAAGVPFPSDRLGKLKMVAQCWTCAALLSMVAGTDLFYECAVGGIWVTLVLVVASGISYTWKARNVLFAGT